MRPVPTLSPEPDPAAHARPLDLAAPFLARLDPREVAVVRTQVSRSLNAPRASSAGRLFDAVASLLGIRDVAEYEAQAAIELEMRAEPTDPEAACSSPGARAIEVAAGEAGGSGSTGPGEASLSDPTAPLPYRLVRRAGLLVYDPAPTLSAILEGRAAGAAASVLAARFQETIAEVSRELAGAARAATGIRTVCLSGGVFQNRWLATALLARLAADGFEVFINRLVPVNDGGISYGQAAVAAARLAEARSAGDRAPRGPARPTAG